MAIIQKVQDFSAETSIVYILGKGSLKKISEEKSISKGAIEAFMSSDKKFDFLKLQDFYIFLVKEDQSAEELRVLGSKIQGMISDFKEDFSCL